MIDKKNEGMHPEREREKKKTHQKREKQDAEIVRCMACLLQERMEA